MEKTSFIPKTVFKPAYREKGAGFFFLLSMTLFLVSLILLGGVFFYQNALNKQISQLNSSLARAKDAFEPSFVIQVDSLSSRIQSAKELIAKHHSLSGLFDFLENNTISSVSFSSFDYNGKSEILLEGEANDYTALAVQSEIFSNSTSVEQVEFSNLSLKQGGKVGFGVKIWFSPELFNYK